MGWIQQLPRKYIVNAKQVATLRSLVVKTKGRQLSWQWGARLRRGPCPADRSTAIDHQSWRWFRGRGWAGALAAGVSFSSALNHAREHGQGAAQGIALLYPMASSRAHP
jgi:hypothetical protein